MNYKTVFKILVDIFTFLRKKNKVKNIETAHVWYNFSYFEEKLPLLTSFEEKIAFVGGGKLCDVFEPCYPFLTPYDPLQQSPARIIILNPDPIRSASSLPESDPIRVEFTFYYPNPIRSA